MAAKAIVSQGPTHIVRCQRPQLRNHASACFGMPVHPAPEHAYLHPKHTASASGWTGVPTFPPRVYHFIVKEAAQSVGVVRCTNPVLRHAHTSRAFDNGEPHLKSNRLKRQAFKLIYKNGAADRALHLIFVSRGNTHSAPRT